MLFRIEALRFAGAYRRTDDTCAMVMGQRDTGAAPSVAADVSPIQRTQGRSLLTAFQSLSSAVQHSQPSRSASAR
jgi:hypothetical protein